jgi:hypothetical protein
MRTFLSCVVVRSSALIALPAVTIVLALHFALREHGWRREWLWAFDLLAFSIMLSGPVIAGVAAWEGVRWSPCRAVVAAADRSAMAVVQYVAAFVGWVWGIHLAAAVALGVVVLTGPVGEAPQLATLTTVLPLAGLLASEVAVGFVIGWASGHGYVAPLVAVGVFVVGLVAYGAEPGLFFEIGGATSSLVGLAPIAHLHVAQAGFWIVVAIGVTVSATLVCDPGNRNSRLALAVAGAATVVMAAIVVSLGVERFRPVPVAVECAGTRPELCLVDGYHDRRPALTERLVAMYSALDDAGVVLPERVSQAATGDPEVDRQAMSISASTELTSVEMVAMVMGILTPPDCDIFASRAINDVHSDLSFWFARELGEAPDDPMISPALTGDDRTLALSVVHDRVDALSRCSP